MQNDLSSHTGRVFTTPVFSLNVPEGVGCLQITLSDLKMIGVFTRNIIFQVGNLRRESAQIKQFE